MAIDIAMCNENVTGLVLLIIYTHNAQTVASSYPRLRKNIYYQDTVF